jgi:hypothetical protein
VVVPDVFTADEVADLTALIDRHEAEVGDALRRRPDGRIPIAESGAITFSTHLVARSPDVARYARHHRLTDLCPQVATGLHRHGTLAHRYVEPLGFECFAAPPEPPHVAEVAAGASSCSARSDPT